MDVPPHPHTGLQTVSWLFSGGVEHRDSAGVHAMVRPGELNLMTAGAGICHSEVSIESDAVLHGVQLWVALPDSDRDTGRDFAHYVPDADLVCLVRWRACFSGSWPAAVRRCTRSPRCSAPRSISSANAGLDIDVDPAFEHGVLCDVGPVAMGETTLAVADLGYQGAGNSSLRLRNVGDRPARVLLLGGTPFTEELVMWWNFVGRSHDDIVGYRRLWQDADDRFGAVTGYRGSVTRLPAPPLPTTRLRPRPIPRNRKGVPHDRRQDRRRNHRHRRTRVGTPLPSTAKPSASPTSPTAATSGSSTTPRSTPSTADEAWRPSSSRRR